MQPVFPHHAQSYPPRGAIWPQFGDDVLEETLSLSEGARQSLNRKREAMNDFHKDNLQHHGLAPRGDDAPPADRPSRPPPPQLPTDHQGRDVPVPMEDDEATMITPASQPPPPPQGPASRVGQDRMRRSPGPSDLPPPDPRYPPGMPPGPRGPPGRYPRTSLAPMDADDPMGPSRYSIGDDDMLTAQGSLGKPPDFPGSGAAPLRSRESFRTPQTGPGGFPHIANPLVSGGGPPPPPGAGGVFIPHYAAGPEPVGLEIASHQGPPGDPYDAAFLQPRVRQTPYERPRVRINGKTPPPSPRASLRDEFFAAPPESMDTAASAPAAIVPMEEQNTVPKRPNEETTAGPKKKATPKAKTMSKKKKKADEIVATQSPPSLPPPPPGGASALKITQKEAEEPDVEPAASSASSSMATSSEPHYRKKEVAGGYRKKPNPDEVIDDLPAVPVKRKTEKPLEDGTPAALRPERQRPRAPQAEPDAEPNPLRVGSSSSSSAGPMIASQRRLM